ncbi:unnamed protein product [Symbiodinium sp. CCMP2592]|nr:unnamed protein product [Symbiodinium sp. CCMP2592]
MPTSSCLCNSAMARPWRSVIRVCRRNCATRGTCATRSPAPCAVVWRIGARRMPDAELEQIDETTYRPQELAGKRFGEGHGSLWKAALGSSWGSVVDYAAYGKAVRRGERRGTVRGHGKMVWDEEIGRRSLSESGSGLVAGIIAGWC